MSDRREYRTNGEVFRQAQKKQQGAEVMAGVITLIMLMLSFAASMAMLTALAAGAWWLLTGEPMFR